MTKTSTVLSRREFSKLTGTAIAALPFLSFKNPLHNQVLKNDKEISVHLFSKHLQFLNYNDMSEVAAEMGFNGLDLTIRRKGHVLPENVKEDLPKAVDAMKKHGLAPKMFSSNVWDATTNINKTVLETASNLGFSHYRTDWLKYPKNVSIVESQNVFAQQATDLALLNKKLGLTGGYQNHSGKHVGAPIWDLPAILNPTQSKHLGVQYDIRHAVLEGAQSWELGLQRIQPYINSIVIKDVKWGVVNGKWKPINVPLGEGMVDFKRYFSLLKKYQINVPISLHLEYDLGGAEKGAAKINIPQKEVFAKMKADVTFLRKTWLNTD